MNINKLKLNIGTEAIIFLTAKQQVDLPANISLTIAGHRVMPKLSARNLDVMLDSGLTMEAHVSQIAKSCYYQIQNIGQIRSNIIDDACKTPVHELVTSRLDYSNASLHGLPRTTLQHLQRVQNSAACFICRT